MSFKLIDISYYQRSLTEKDFRTIKNSGVDGVILRIMAYYREKDGAFEQHIKNAVKVGLHVGVYCFSYALTNQDAKAEAEKVLKILEPHKKEIDIPVFFDWEYDSMNYAEKKGKKLTKSQITGFYKVFLEEIEKAGYKGGVYYNYDIASRWVDLSKLGKYAKWIAYYGTQKPKDVDIWQYTESGKIPGIDMKLDLDNCYTEFWKKEVKKVATIKWKGKLTDHFSAAEYTVGNTDSAVLTLTERSYHFAMLLEKFRVWLKRPMTVSSWARTEALNKKVGGISTSNHLTGCACDWSTNIKITKEKFIKYSKKWKKICAAAGYVGESGLYEWGAHFGIQSASQVKANGGKYFHWDSRSGVQKNNPFTI